jgi:hypothetical protein
MLLLWCIRMLDLRCICLTTLHAMSIPTEAVATPLAPRIDMSIPPHLPSMHIIRPGLRQTQRILLNRQIPIRRILNFLYRQVTDYVLYMPLLAALRMLLEEAFIVVE